MLKTTRKPTALILTYFLLTVQLTVELAHQHFAPNVRKPDNSSVWQSQSQGPELKNRQSLCPACFFANQHQSIHQAIACFIDPQPLIFISPLSSSLFSQFHTIPCRNRAPPV